MVHGDFVRRNKSRMDDYIILNYLSHQLTKIKSSRLIEIQNTLFCIVNYTTQCQQHIEKCPVHLVSLIKHHGLFAPYIVANFTPNPTFLLTFLNRKSWFTSWHTSLNPRVFFPHTCYSIYPINGSFILLYLVSC